MSTKLTNITTQYSKFTDNQVLTKNQLNTFLDYFDDQDRLTRVSLVGVGIACGFKIFSTNSSITITQGTGVTTDGDLLKLLTSISNSTELIRESVTYTYYREFTDENAKYEPFKDLLNTSGGTFLELLTTSEDGTSSINSGVLNGKLDLSKKVVLLYLECYENEDTICSALDCDNQGQEQITNLRVLLVDKENAKLIGNKDTIFKKYNWSTDLEKLRPLAVKKDIINPLNAKTLSNLQEAYKLIISDTDLLDKLERGYNTLYGRFFLDKKYRVIKNIFLSPSFEDFQYLYDLLKDLVDSYNEIRSLILQLDTDCCPDIFAFPKHLMLGALSFSGQENPYRHKFYKTGTESNTQKLKQVLSILRRIESLYTNFKGNKLAKKVEVTPSKLRGNLSEKAIPFYYSLDRKLLDNWSYTKYTEQLQNTNLSYHKELLSKDLHVQNPLEYCYDKFGFYRIEGIHGLPFKEAFELIEDQRTSKGLNFDVKVLSISRNISDFDINDYLCHFEDLKVLLDAWHAEQECILKSMTVFFSGFSTNKVGENSNIKEYLDTRKLADRLNVLEKVEAIGVKPNVEIKKEIAEKEKEVLAEEVIKRSAAAKREKIDQGKGILIGDKFFEETEENAVLFAKFKQIDAENQTRRDLLESKERELQKQLEKEELDFLEILAGDTKGAISKKDLKNQFEFPKFIDPNKNPVLDNISNKEETIGPIAKKVFENNKQSSVADIQTAMRAEVSDLLNTPEWKKNPGLQDFIKNDVVDVLAHGFVLIERSPKSLFEIDSLKIKNYEVTIDRICKLVNNLRVTYQKVNLKDTLKSIVGLLINQLSTICCSGEKLEILLKAIEERKGRVLKQIQLSEFIKKHPGLHHHAGVPEGGTFIMAYVGSEDVVEETFKQISLPITFFTNPKSGNSGYLKLWNERFSTKFQFISITREEDPERVNNKGAIEKNFRRLLEKNKERILLRIEEEAKKILTDTKDINTSLKLSQRQISFLLFSVASLQDRKNVNHKEVFYETLQDFINPDFDFIKKVPSDIEKEIRRGFTAGFNTFLENAKLSFIGLTNSEKKPIDKGIDKILISKEGGPREEALKELEELLSRDLKVEVSVGKNNFEEYDKAFKDEEIFKKAIESILENSESIEEDKPPISGASIIIGKTIEETVLSLRNYLNNLWRIAGITKTIQAVAEGNTLIISINDIKIKPKENFILFSNPEIYASKEPLYFDSNAVVTNIFSKNTVVADFALPYMCCSDCDPVNFVLPKEPTSLSLPKNFICLSDDAVIQPLVFAVQPADAIIKAVVKSGIDGGVFLNDAGLYEIDPNRVDPSLYRKPIRFTVNDQPTSTSFIVYNKLELTITNSIRYTNNNKKAFVTYKVSGENSREANYFWKLGDGRESNSVPNSIGEVIFEYNLPINEENSITPVLQAGFGPCISNFGLDTINFKDIIIPKEFEIKKEEVCLSKKIGQEEKISFSITPEELTVIEKGTSTKGVTIDNKSKTIFISGKDGFNSFKKPLVFTVKEETSLEDSFTVFNKDTFADIDFELSRGEVIPIGLNSFDAVFTISGLTNKQKEEFGFNWSFGDKTFSSSVLETEKYDVKHTYNISREKPGIKEYKVILTIEGGPCNLIEIEKTITVELVKLEEETPTFELLEENDVFCLDKGNLEIQFKVTPPTTNISVKGNVKGIFIDPRGEITIDAKNFKSYGVPIQFLLNNKLDAGKIITIINKSNFVDFDIMPNPLIVNKDTKNVIFNFIINGEFTKLNIKQRQNLEVIWNFADGVSIRQKGDKIEFVVFRNFTQYIGATIMGDAILLASLRVLGVGGPCGEIIIAKDAIVKGTGEYPIDNPRFPTDRSKLSIDGPTPISVSDPSRFDRENIKLTTNNKTLQKKDCNEITISLINNDNSLLNPEVKTNAEVRNTVVIPTVNLYNTIDSKKSNYISGANNSSLTKDFGNLIGTTQGLMQENKEKTTVIATLYKHLGLQIKLFYNIFRCQKDFKGQEFIINQIISALNWIRKNNPARLDKFKVFFEELMNSSSISDELRIHLANQITPIFKGIR